MLKLTKEKLIKQTRKRRNTHAIDYSLDRRDFNPLLHQCKDNRILSFSSLFRQIGYGFYHSDNYHHSDFFKRFHFIFIFFYYESLIYKKHGVLALPTYGRRKNDTCSVSCKV